MTFDPGTFDPRKWVQVANDLRERIDTGQLKPFDRVSITDEVRVRRVDRRTVSHALRLLEAEGRVVRFYGIGYVVRGADPQPET